MLNSVEKIQAKQEQLDHQDILRNFDALSRGEILDNGLEKLAKSSEMIKNVAKKAVDFVKENQETLTKGALTMLTLYGVRKLIDKFSGSEKPQNSKEGFWGFLKNFLGIGTLGAGLGMSTVMIEKMLHGDFSKGTDWFKEKVAKHGRENVEKWLKSTLGEEKAANFLSFMEESKEFAEESKEKLQEGIYFCKDKLQKAREFCISNGLPLDLIPNFKEVQEAYLKNKNTLEKAGIISASAILTWYFTKKLKKNVFKLALRHKAMSLVALSGLSYVLFSDTEFFKNQLKKIGIEDKDQDGQIELKEVMQKGAEGIKYLNNKLNEMMEIFGFTERGANIVKLFTGYLMLKFGKSSIIKGTIKLSGFVAVVSAIQYIIEENLLNEDQDLSGEDLLKMAISKAAEVSPDITESKDEMLDFFRDPQAHKDQIELSIGSNWAINIMRGGANFLGDFFAELGEEGIEFLDTISNNPDCTVNIKAYIEQVANGEEQFDLLKMAEALKADGGAIFFTDGVVGFAFKGVKGYVYILSQSLEAIGKTIAELTSDPSWGGVVSAARTYLIASSPFIIYGATKGLIKGKLSPISAAQGAAKGVLAPINVIKGAFDVGVKSARFTKNINEWVDIKASNLSTISKSAYSKLPIINDETSRAEALSARYRAVYRNERFWNEDLNKAQKNAHKKTLEKIDDKLENLELKAKKGVVDRELNTAWIISNKEIVKAEENIHNAQKEIKKLKSSLNNAPKSDISTIKTKIQEQIDIINQEKLRKIENQEALLKTYKDADTEKLRDQYSQEKANLQAELTSPKKVELDSVSYELQKDGKYKCTSKEGKVTYIHIDDLPEKTAIHLEKEQVKMMGRNLEQKTNKLKEAVASGSKKAIELAQKAYEDSRLSLTELVKKIPKEHLPNLNLGKMAGISMKTTGVVLLTIEAGRIVRMLLEGDNDSALRTTAQVTAEIAPLTGTYLDGRRAIDAFMNGEIKEGLVDSAWFTLGALSDVALVSGLFTWAGMGARGAISSAKAARVASKVSKIKKIAASPKFAKLKTAGTLAMTASGFCAMAYLNCEKTETKI